MADSFSIVVILPNARRETMKVTKNTTVLQVLEDVCTKRGFNSNEYDLKHYNRIVELANTIRFSGLPNNATLEMVPITKVRQESLVNLGLQLESGKRLMHKFSSNVTLWDILTHWEQNGEKVFSEDKEISPVVIYMRQEIFGEEQLRSKTLRSLGLTHGSAMLRLILRSESQLRHQANVSAPISRPVLTAATDEHKVSKPHIKPQPSQPTGHSLSSSPPKDVKPIDYSIPKSEATQEKSQQEQQPKKDHFASAVTGQGYTLNKPIPKAVKSDEKMDVEYNTTEKNKVELKKPDGPLHILGDHDAVIYNGKEIVHNQQNETISDDFFEVTLADVDSMFRDLQKKRRELEESPLQTSSARNLEKDSAVLRNLKMYPVTIVRVKMPSHHVLQGTFRSVDTISSIAHFVKKFLVNQNMTFYLFTAPPKKILKNENRLVEEELIGSAVIYFGSEELIEDAIKLIKPQYLEKLSSPSAVFYHIKTQIEKDKPKIDPISLTSILPSPPAQPQVHQQIEPQPGSSNQNHPPPSPIRNQNQDSSKVPKWFKTGK